MQDHRLDPSGSAEPAPIQHLDLVTAELRRRIAGIGLAIAELREETGRLRASADGRYPAVALLDRPSAAAPRVRPSPAPGGTAVAERPVDPTDRHTRSSIDTDVALAEPVSPWGTSSAVSSPVDSWTESVPDTADVTLTWVPEPTIAAPAMAVRVPDEVPAEAASVTLEPAPSGWGDADADAEAAFDAFFSAEIEPEPSQRWLLSD